MDKEKKLQQCNGVKNNNEVTLRIRGSIDEFKKVLKEKGYVETEHFILYDTFMIPESLEIEKLSAREIISKAIIIRKVEDIANNEIRRDVSYKMKKFNDKGEILEQKSTRLKVFDCEEAQRFMQAIGYKKLMNITEEDYGYKKDEIIITTKDVKNGDKMIEMETQFDNKNLNTVEKLIEKLKMEELPLDFEDCFVKKAEVELNKLYKELEKGINSLEKVEKVSEEEVYEELDKI
jgi:hypothetical protein